MWALGFLPTLVIFAAAHWEAHVRVARGLDEAGTRAWRSLGWRDRWRMRWTLRRGRAVRDGSLAALAAQVARVERDLLDKPRARLFTAFLTLLLVGLGVVALVSGDGFWAALFFSYAAMSGSSALCQPSMVRCLGRAAEANARAAGEAAA